MCLLVHPAKPMKAKENETAINVRCEFMLGAPRETQIPWCIFKV
jgi:hypothetical protein